MREIVVQGGERYGGSLMHTLDAEQIFHVKRTEDWFMKFGLQKNLFRDPEVCG